MAAAARLSSHAHSRRPLLQCRSVPGFEVARTQVAGGEVALDPTLAEGVVLFPVRCSRWQPHLPRPHITVLLCCCANAVRELSRASMPRNRKKNKAKAEAAKKDAVDEAEAEAKAAAAAQAADPSHPEYMKVSVGALLVVQLA